MKLASRPALAAAAALLVLSLGATACSDHEGGSGSDATSSLPPLPSGEPGSFQVETHTTIGRVVGKVGKQDRQRVAGAITPVLQRWFDAAYVGGDYPRTNFRDAFPGFTAGAREQARRDKRLMSNQGIGDRISGVTPKTSRLWLDVLAVGKGPVAVTARFRLAFRTHGDLERRVGLGGRVMLTRSKTGWRIFGYQVARTGAKA